MAKGKTQFTCTERRIDRSKWRWTVYYLGECLGTGIVKTQAECRKEKERVKAEFVEKNSGRATEHVNKALHNRFAYPGGYRNPVNRIFDYEMGRGSVNTPAQQRVSESEATSLRPL